MKQHPIKIICYCGNDTYKLVLTPSECDIQFKNNFCIVVCICNECHKIIVRTEIRYAESPFIPGIGSIKQDGPPCRPSEIEAMNFGNQKEKV